MQQQATGVHDAIMTTDNQQPVSMATVDSNQGFHTQSAEKCVTMQGLSGGLTLNSQNFCKDVNTPIGVQHGLSNFDDNDCDMDTIEQVGGAVGGISGNDMQGQEDTISRLGTKRCLDDTSGDCTKKRRTGGMCQKVFSWVFCVMRLLNHY